MKVLIIGANGQLGRDCQVALAPDHELVCLDLPQFDLTRRESVEEWLQRVEPEAVVNCAAYTAVDRAESEPELCELVNATGPALLAAACAALGTKLIHISTDYVFDGSLPLGQAYHESDRPNPVSVYGRTKLAGEAPVLAWREGAVLRTAWLYGASGPNFLLTMLRLALRRPAQPIRVVDDQYGAPTWSGRLARQIARLLEEWQPGLYHATALGVTTWYQVAQRFLERMEVEHELLPITTADYPTPARRPANSVLAHDNLTRNGLDVMHPWEVDLDAFTIHQRQEWLRRVQA